ncbi:lysozyme g-like isoform X2 [Petromyzon marinus]|uniref:lysozyme g-like isoform X1 n=1 Tax=Petromyzon marinus TaxID=7757 RepID=UPI003F71A696
MLAVALLLLVASSGVRASGCYGNVMNIDTTGASASTASQDNLSVTGVTASQRLVNTDLNRLKNYKSRIVEAGNAKCVDAAVIAAIISRESRAGNVLVNGWGDGGNGFGLMQVDKRYHTPVGAWDSVEHMKQATGILIDMINSIKKKFPSWTQDQQMKGGISAYNAGPGNVQSYPNMDIGTTGNDYANDVVARAQWLRSNGHF